MGKNDTMICELCSGVGRIRKDSRIVECPDCQGHGETEQRKVPEYGVTLHYTVTREVGTQSAVTQITGIDIETAGGAEVGPETVVNIMGCLIQDLAMEIMRYYSMALAGIVVMKKQEL